MAAGVVGFCCCFVRLAVLLSGFCEIATVDFGGTVGVEAATLDILPCIVGRFTTDGALVCRANGAGITAEPLDDAIVSFG